MPRMCESCGDSLGSRYHEAAHSADVETASVEDLEAAAAIYDRVTGSENPNCNGSGPHDAGSVKLYPLGGGAHGILCLKCWARENRHRYNQGKWSGRPEEWPQHDWATAQEYVP